MSTHEMIDNWNGEMGRRWAEMADLMDRILEPVGAYLIDQIALSPDMRVLDIGCGAGATTLAAAHRLTDGQALGVDVSHPLLETASRRAEAMGWEHVAFTEADAETWRYDGAPFDLVMSRFGVMFFEDPAAAFSNIRSMMKPGAALAFVAWRPPEHAELLSLPMKVVAPFLKDPAERPGPNAPGPFGLADGDRTQRLLETAGWSDISVAPVDLSLRISAQDGAQFYDRTLIPALVEAQGLDDAPIRAAFAEALDARRDEEGFTVLKAGVWFITATA